MITGAYRKPCARSRPGCARGDGGTTLLSTAGSGLIAPRKRLEAPRPKTISATAYTASASANIAANTSTTATIETTIMAVFPL
jgi:hypothetical protein